MLTRRRFIAATALLPLAAPALANTVVSYPKLPRKFMPQTVDVNPDLPAGEIHVVKDQFYLFWTLGNGRARRYGIAVGAEGRNYTGVLTIERKAVWPSWRPTPGMIRKEPQVYGPFAAGLPGGHPQNALGARALYLHNRDGDTFYRIHGTPMPDSIGKAFSSGCVRLRNDHVAELYDLVPVGTRVYLF
ncbi:L,D-transpeptidase [Loktanella sp. SALINAS62]|uniref:L,D-transpeptidase n=1 Tax=Loktanella sp. SALINAS62 TaxID=2706124 RepID=UPI001B8CEDB8|nr:L,D-transpeptidase [Loktanella sp. SALINAS62]MBS1302345.1 L,D-transpeptidase [Loktanella sp. SALINAS62]